MGVWDLYFITKLILYFDQHIGFHPWLNLAFAVFLAAPIPDRYPNRKRLKLLRQVIAVPAGISLFYYDSWLPSIMRALSQTSAMGGFSGTYLLELAQRFFNPKVVGILLLSYAIYFVASKRIRVSSVVFAAMLVPLLSFGHDKTQPLPQGTVAAANPLSGPPTDANLNAQLSAFYAGEAARAVSFSPPPGSDEPFDVLILQICSLSWDDLDFTKQRDNPLFSRFNIVFTNFSSGASYSGPAAIRLLRGSCGQPRHKQLYDEPLQQCLTFGNLSRIGFQEQLAMNHNGQYGGFLDDLRVRGGLTAPLFENKNLPPYLQSFDGSPVYEDFPVLSKWWDARLKLRAPRVALFYNTISLHDGNYFPGHRSNSMEIYPTRLETLLKDLDRFFSVLQASGRRAVVVVVAEHGASVRGDKMQIAGMREIPTPRISTVPVGIKLIGLPDKPGTKPYLVSKPSSYLALNQLLANFITVSPFAKTSLTMADYAGDLPETNFVAENEDVVVMRRGKRYFIHSKGEDWVEYDASE